MAEPTQYSTTATMDQVVPGAGDDWLFPVDTYEDDYNELAPLAFGEINDEIGSGTATPVTGPAKVLARLAEIEALLVAHRRASAVFAARSEEGVEPYRGNFRARAMGILAKLRFPSSCSTPAKSPIFAGEYDLTVETFDDFTTSALWLLVCQTGGPPDSAVFKLWDRRNREAWHTWKLSEGLSWPVRKPSDDPLGIAFQLRLTIAPSGETPAEFAAGDSWSFRTYPRWRKKMKRGLRFVQTRRGGVL